MATRSLGQLTIDLIAKTFGFEQGMDKAARKAKSGGKEIEGALTGAFKTIGAAVAGFVAGLATVDTALRGFQQSVDFADRMDELSARFKISTETLSEWAYAAKLTGSDIEGLAGIIPKFSKTVADAADAGSEAGKTFAALGISVKDQAGQLRSFQDLLPEIMDRFKGLNNETTETALAMQLFGRSGAEFLEFLNLGSDGLTKMGERARELGIVIDSETAGAAAEFKDRVDDLRAATQGWFTQIAADLLPAMTDLVESLADLVKSGEGAATVVQAVNAAMDAGTWVVDKYNRAVVNASIGMEMAAGTAAGLLEAYKNVATFGFADGSIAGGLGKATGDYVQGIKDWQKARDEYLAAQRQGPRPEVQLIDPSEGLDAYQTQKRLAEQAEQTRKRLQALYSGSDKAGGKSAAEQEAERLFQAYDSLAASLDQQIALFGQTSEAAKTRYEVEFGSLVNLEPKLKNYLVYKAEELDAVKEAAAAQEERRRQAKQEADDFARREEHAQQLVSDLQFELELMRMSNEERAVAIQLRGMETAQIERYGEEIVALNKQIEEEMQRTEIMDGFRDSFATFFEDVIGGTKSVKDAFGDMLNDIAAMITRRVVESWMEQLFGDFGSSGSGTSGDWISAIAGIFSGGRANGGWTSPRSIYEVNERGLETATVNGRTFMLTGNNPVEVTPNHRLGGGGSVTNNFAFSAPTSSRTQTQVAARVGYEVRRAQRLGA